MQFCNNSINSYYTYMIMNNDQGVTSLSLIQGNFEFKYFYNTVGKFLKMIAIHS